MKILFKIVLIIFILTMWTLFLDIWRYGNGVVYKFEDITSQNYIMQGNITALQGNITALQGNITALQGNITALQGNITLQTRRCVTF